MGSKAVFVPAELAELDQVRAIMAGAEPPSAGSTAWSTRRG